MPTPNKLVVGLFFDGTDNNMERDRPRKAETNVVRLYDLYQQRSDVKVLQDKFYIDGVGSRDMEQESLKAKVASQMFGGVSTPQGLGAYVAAWAFYGASWLDNTSGQVTGSGGVERIFRACRRVLSLCDQVGADTEKLVDVYGFSRGAALARTFVNIVNQVMKPRMANLHVRFVGLFDTVGSFGIPGNRYDPGMQLYIDETHARTIKHYVARHEIRKNFPLVSIPGMDRRYAGAHSDVGGGYGPGEGGRSNHLALIPFADMCDASLSAGVSMNHWRTSLASFGLTESGLATLRKQAEDYAGDGAMIFDPQGEYARKRSAFFKKYIHQSHGEGVGMEPEKDFQRRVFVPKKPSTPLYERLKAQVDTASKNYREFIYKLNQGLADTERWLKSGYGRYPY